ncbi:isoaspartyl peptidase/L-asparaginase family protein [Aurantiacibacter hainanensis]|uniref:isoaspartyl peptidase/L-asparaginase family protein n=1 Tax=Aurantiacibacter hainanensis TaxID=3076114 RepID=UPI0030C754F8
MAQRHVIALHGGAGVNPDRQYAEVEEHLDHLVRECEAMLSRGEDAIDTVEHAVASMEQSGLYVAGRGSAPNDQGVVECDASIMDGARLRAGGICAAAGIAEPIRAARAVMEHSPYVLLAGEGARAFAIEHGVKMVEDPESHYRVPVGIEREEMLRLDKGLSHGTVGAVALDRNGALAAATSTGGLLGKRAGRVGDTPISGIGNWADQDVAVSCTGIGEAFIYAGGARDLAARMAYRGDSLEQAGKGLLDAVSQYGGDGGLIAVDRNGTVTTPFNSAGMKRALAGSDLDVCVSIL